MSAHTVEAWSELVIKEYRIIYIFVTVLSLGHLERTILLQETSHCLQVNPVLLWH